MHLLTYLPFLKLKYEWMPFLHISVFIILFMSVDLFSKGLNFDQFQNDILFFVIVANCFLCFFTTGSLDGEFDGLMYWATSHGEQIRQINEYEYYRLFAHKFRSFSAIYIVFFYITYKLQEI